MHCNKNDLLYGYLVWVKEEECFTMLIYSDIADKLNKLHACVTLTKPLQINQSCLIISKATWIWCWTFLTSCFSLGQTLAWYHWYPYKHRESTRNTKHYTHTKKTTETVVWSQENLISVLFAQNFNNNTVVCIIHWELNKKRSHRFSIKITSFL